MVSIPTNEIVNSGQIYAALTLYSSYGNSAGPWCYQGMVAVVWKRGVPAQSWPVTPSTSAGILNSQQGISDRAAKQQKLEIQTDAITWERPSPGFG